MTGLFFTLLVIFFCVLGFLMDALTFWEGFIIVVIGGFVAGFIDSDI